MMSAAGPVASGSAVALCQSIGATGAVSATTAFVANTAAGAAIGGAAVKTYSMHGSEVLWWKHRRFRQQ